ncbi:DivIVA domain-containing protein [Millisia brevis]|uniref:DivIVA domain-containing protein n=1 Tax=Millisia brevis TaxID=264148 RepID=UPI000A003B29|nr:DivIVA domain-containing protein [Millisia brevis]
MGTLFLYVVGISVVGGLLFIVASALFGRSEELEPLPQGVSPTVLPAVDVRGDDVRALRFRLRVRGYDQRDVDWTLARLADRIDELNARIDAIESDDSQPPVAASARPTGEVRSVGAVERVTRPGAAGAPTAVRMSPSSDAADSADADPVATGKPQPGDGEPHS